MPRRTTRDAHALCKCVAECLVFIDDQFGWPQSLHLGMHGLDVRHFGEAKATAGEIEPGDADSLAGRDYRGDQVVASFCQ